MERRAPAVVALGARVGVEIEVRATTGRALEIEVTDDVPPALHRIEEGGAGRDADPGIRAHRIRVRLAPVAVAEYRVLAAERGEHVIGDVHLRVPGPWGLLRRQARLQMRTPIRVQPGVDDVRRYRLLGLRHRLHEMGMRPVRGRGAGTSFESLREYIRGDDPRHVDWKASARHGKLIVRQYEAERSQNLLLVIDAGRAMRERIGGAERIDHALSAALLLAHVARGHDDRVGVLVFSDRVHRYLAPSRAGLDRIAELLGTVDTRPVEPDYPGAFRHLARVLSRRSLVVVFSDVLGDRESRALLAHLAPAARRHLPLLVALRNPALEAMAELPPERESDVYRRVAAEELLERRGRALHRMRRQGVSVVDARPDAAVAETVNAYLDVKRRALL